VESRILVVADVFMAMAENRPYRRGMDTERILAIIEADVPKKIDRQCFMALKNVTTGWNSPMLFNWSTEIDMSSFEHRSSFPIEEEIAQLI